MDNAHIHNTDGENTASIQKVANEQKLVSWVDIIKDLTDIIQSNYDGKSIQAFRGDWKRRIKLCIKVSGHKLINFTDEEIAASIIKASDDQKVIIWTGKITILDEIIQGSYDGSALNIFRGDWKRHIKFMVKALGYKLINFTDEEITASIIKLASEQKVVSWLYIILDLTDTTQSNYDGKSIQVFIGDWKRRIKLIMKKVADFFSYEHPVHSMILEPTDQIWNEYFTSDELNEIKSFNLKHLPTIPTEIDQYMNNYDKKWNSGLQLYEYADSFKHNPISEFDKKWIRESFIRASELFLNDSTLVLNDYSEGDLLHDVWPFVYRAFKDKSIKATLGEKSSVAVALGRNEQRCIEGLDRRTRKACGAKVDILFKICNKELGCCEVGKDNVTDVDDKYLDDGLIKLPKNLRDMFAALIKETFNKAT